MKERWFSSVIKAANGPLAADDEGMSYVSYGATPEEKFLLKDAVDELGADLIGGGIPEEIRHLADVRQVLRQRAAFVPPSSP